MPYVMKKMPEEVQEFLRELKTLFDNFVNVSEFSLNAYSFSGGDNELTGSIVLDLPEGKFLSVCVDDDENSSGWDSKEYRSWEPEPPIKRLSVYEDRVLSLQTALSEAVNTRDALLAEIVSQQEFKGVPLCCEGVNCPCPEAHSNPDDPCFKQP